MMDENGSFTARLYDPENWGTAKDQGGHMVVLEDYTVQNVPGYGTLGEGDMDDAAKAAAVEGDVTTLIAKNSWGRDRTDRPVGDGYTRFEWGFLTDALPWYAGEAVNYEPALQAFVLPPGY